MSLLQKGSLILYKSRPGKITQVGKKISIQLDNGNTVSVRPKDIQLLHPGPVQSLNLSAPNGDVATAWELLQGESASLEDIAELAFDAYTPVTAWAVWQLINDGLYFSGSPTEITVHSTEEVSAEQANRAEKAAKEQAWQAFLTRLQGGHFLLEDEPNLQEIVAVAYQQRQNSRLLKALNLSETREQAHQLLLDIGYWDTTHNPYPFRQEVTIEQPTPALPDLPDEPRHDLTHLPAFAIDDEGSQDPDDALSFDNGTLWVHIADVAALVTPDSPADLEARDRGANLYLPEGTVHMLPGRATTTLALGLTDISPALSFGLEILPEGQIGNLEITPSLVRVTRLTYHEADEQIESHPILSQLYQIATAYYQRRQANGSVEIELPEIKVRVTGDEIEITPIPNLSSRTLVREAMLMTGEAVGKYAQEHEIPLPYTSQPPPDTDQRSADSPAGNFALRRAMRPGQQQSTPAPHSGLGMDIYVQCTSPLRRYLDLVVHQQLRAHLAGQEPLDEKAVMERVGSAMAISGNVRRAERLSIRHWIHVYLSQNPEWQGEGIIIDQRGSRSVILIPKLDLETQLYLPYELPLDSQVTIQLQSVNLTELTTHFSIINNLPINY